MEFGSVSCPLSKSVCVDGWMCCFMLSVYSGTAAGAVQSRRDMNRARNYSQ